MRPAASESENRTHGAEKIGPNQYSDFFNRIGPSRHLVRCSDMSGVIGLERYAAAFAENDVDVAVLPHLTDALKKLAFSSGIVERCLACRATEIASYSS